MFGINSRSKRVLSATYLQTPNFTTNYKHFRINFHLQTIRFDFRFVFKHVFTSKLRVFSPFYDIQIESNQRPGRSAYINSRILILRDSEETWTEIILESSQTAMRHTSPNLNHNFCFRFFVFGRSVILVSLKNTLLVCFLFLLNLAFASFNLLKRTRK